MSDNLIKLKIETFCDHIDQAIKRNPEQKKWLFNIVNCEEEVIEGIYNYIFSIGLKCVYYYRPTEESDNYRCHLIVGR